MRMPPAQTSGTTWNIQRKLFARTTAEDELPEREGSVSHISQARETRRAEVSVAGQTEINGMQGGARPLPQSERDFFEPRFGHDFGAVKVHDDARAAGAARTLTARAFTIGDRIVFGPGEFSPQTGDGRRLLAHELAHVVQQRKGSSETPPIQIQRTLNNEPTRLHTGTIPTKDYYLSEEKDLDDRIAGLNEQPSASGTGSALAVIDYIHIPKGDASGPDRIAMKAALLSVVRYQEVAEKYTDAEYRLRVPKQSNLGMPSPYAAFIIIQFDSARNAEVTLVTNENPVGRRIEVGVGDGLVSKTPADLTTELSAEYGITFVTDGITVKLPGDSSATTFTGKAWALDDLRLISDSLKLIGSTEKSQMRGVKFRRINKDSHDGTAGFYHDDSRSINMMDSALPYEEGTWFGEDGKEYSRGVHTTLHEIGHMLHWQTKQVAGKDTEVLELFKRAVRDESRRITGSVPPNTFPPPGIILPTNYSGTGNDWTDFFSDTYSLFILQPSFLKTPTHQYLYDFYLSQYPR